jgi:signal transduction histidine kinase
MMKTASNHTEAIGSDHIKAVLETLKAQLSRIHHDVNNPVTVISGNTELIRELAKALGVEDDFKGPLEDMEAALDELSERIDKLMTVRKMMADLSESI